MSKIDEVINSLSEEELDMLNSDPKMLSDFKTKYSEPQSLAERTSGFIKRPLNVLPMPGLPFVPAQKGVNVVKAGIESDKNYPAQNLLPAAGGIIGGVVGGAATLPSGAGVPFGATAGTIIGTQAGGAAKEYVDVLRGRPTPSTPMESLEKTGLPALGAGAMELGTAGAFRVAKGVGAGKLAKEGMTKFSEKMSQMFKPEAKEFTEAAFNKIKDIPALDTGESETVKAINDIFGKRGISAGGQQGLSPSQVKNFADAGLSPQDVQQLSESMSSVRKSVGKIAKGKAGITLESDLSTTPLNKYQELGNVLKDLDKADLTYGQLRQIKQRVGDIANLDKPDIARTPIEKLYGVVYHNLGLDMAKTAEKEGVTEVHNQVMNEGRKYYQEKLLKNVLETSTTRTKGISRIKYSDLANNLKSYTEDELVRKFGEDAKYIKVLRDVAETHAETFGQGKLLSGGISTHGSAYGFLHPHVISRVRTPTYINRILKNYLGEEGVKEYSDMLFKSLSVPQKITSGVAKGTALPFAPMVTDEPQ